MIDKEEREEFWALVLAVVIVLAFGALLISMDVPWWQQPNMWDPKPELWK